MKYGRRFGQISSQSENAIRLQFNNHVVIPYLLCSQRYLEHVVCTGSSGSGSGVNDVKKRSVVVVIKDREKGRRHKFTIYFGNVCVHHSIQKYSDLGIQQVGIRDDARIITMIIVDLWRCRNGRLWGSWIYKWDQTF